jgi:hypothetical protein
MNPLTVICDFTLSRLPDSLSERRLIVDSLAQLLPRSHPSHQQVLKHLDLLNRVELDQREFSFGDEVGIQRATRGEPSTPIPPPPPNFRRSRGSTR